MSNLIKRKTKEKIIKNILGNLSEKALYKLFDNILNGKIPIVTNDEELQEVIDEFNLTDPLYFAKFIVEAHYAEYDCIIESIGGLKKWNLADTLSPVEKAKGILMLSMENDDFDLNVLKTAQHELISCTTQLNRKLNDCINSIIETDNLSEWKKFVRSRALLKQIDVDVNCAKIAICGIMEATHLQLLISQKTNFKIESSVIQPYLSMLNSLLTEENCKLMYKHDSSETDKFWYDLRKKFNNVLIENNSIKLLMDSE